MKKVALHNLGCKVNAYEMEVMQQMLAENGFLVVPFEQESDIYIVNTCSVTNIADRKSRQMLHRAKKRNPDAVIVAVGCYVQTRGEKEVLEDGVDLVIGNNRKKDLVSILNHYFEGLKEETVIDINQTNEYENMMLTRPTEHTRACIKVQDGCNQFCSYCIIPYARGRVRSRARIDVLREVAHLSEKGYKEIVLTGIHLSSYGKDTNDSLIGLIRQVHGVDGIKRIRLGSLEPRIVTEDFARELSGLEKICPHFHLSLQSGCAETLRRMNRHYTPEEYSRGVELLRHYFHNPAITTDVIVGFPGETDQEFEASRAFLAQTEFYETHIFKYSKRKGTRAAIMENQIPENIKAQRSENLLLLNEKNKQKYEEALCGCEAEMIVEEDADLSGQRFQTGYTKEYVRVYMKNRGIPAGEIVKGVVSKHMENGCVEFLPSEGGPGDR